MRIAAVGDIHFGVDAEGTLRPHLERLADEADALLLAGDLSRRGKPEEAEALVEEITPLQVPTVAVLGNHEFESDRVDEFRKTLEAADIVVLEGESTVIETRRGTLGVAGTVGFGVGFPGASCADFGEREMKMFVARSRETARTLAEALDELQTDVTVSLTHYSPVRDTLVGEDPEIFPFLGSYHLGEAIDGAQVDIAFHGHAHHGVEKGTTPGGVPVRNVAQPVLRQAYKVYELGA